MLVLSRKEGERIVIGERIVMTVVEMRGGRVRLAFDAPPEVAIHRQEIHRRFTDHSPVAAVRSAADESTFFPECA